MIDELDDWRWRLTNLYWLVNEAGKAEQFAPNPEQLDLLGNLHSNNLVLKASTATRPRADPCKCGLARAVVDPQEIIYYVPN